MGTPISKAMLQAAKKSTFNSNSWTPDGDPVPLKDLWDTMSPGLYDTIDGEIATVTEVTFADGNSAFRISIPIKDGAPIELPIGKDLEDEVIEGTELDISTITAQLLRKAGQEPIMRYSAELWEKPEEEEPEPAPKKRRTRLAIDN